MDKAFSADEENIISLTPEISLFIIILRFKITEYNLRLIRPLLPTYVYYL